MIAALLILDAQFLDLGTMLAALQHYGIGGESNPMVLSLYTAGGLPLIVGIKVMAAVGGAWLVLRVRPYRRTFTAFTAIAAGIGLFGAATNVLALAVR